MARGNGNEPDLSAVLARLEKLEKENASLRASQGSGLDGRLLRVLARQGLKDAREDLPDPTPEIQIEVAFAPTSLVVGRGRFLDKMEAVPLDEEESRGFPPGLFKRATLVIHESELPAFKALCEGATEEEIARVHREADYHADLWKSDRVNDLEGRTYLPAFSAAYRRELKREMNPILYVKTLSN